MKQAAWNIRASRCAVALLMGAAAGVQGVVEAVRWFAASVKPKGQENGSVPKRCQKKYLLFF